MVKLKATANLELPEVFEKKIGKFDAKNLIAFEEITDYSLIADKKLAKKLKVNDIEERTDAKKSKKVKRELETKRTKKTKNELKGIKKKDSKKEEKKIMNSSPVESTPSSTEIGLKPSTESKPIAEDAAKKLKREQKLKKIAKRKKKKEKLKKEIQAKKIERKMKTNSTSRVSTAVEDIDNTEGFNQEDFNEKMAEWNDMMLPHVLLRALYDKGFYKPMPIQKLVLPEAIKNRSNIIGTAQTGSGKTLAFGLPILTHMIDFFNSNLYSNENESEVEKIPQALILTPTRELAIQIKEHLQGVCKYQKAKICVLVGGINQMKQERLIKQEPEIIVATPGRLMQLLDEGNDYLNKIGKIKYLVIDEADRMIEKGHFGEMEKILAVVNNDELFKKKRQNFLFSATLITKFQNDIKDEETIMKPKSDEQLQKDLKKALNSLVEKVQMNKEPQVYDLTTNAVTGDNLIESKLFCSKTEKDIYMYYFLSKYVGRTLVFCNSIDCVRRLTALFRYLKKTPLTLHANMEQKQRLKNLEKFNAEPNSLMIASDVASRGLDIPNVINVIHYQTPRSAEIYVHRSGRTARALKEGLSVMLVSPDEMNIYRKVLQGIRKDKDFRDYPIDLDYFNHCKKIVTIARKIDEIEHQLNKAKNETNWYDKHAKLLDLDLDDELLKENEVDSAGVSKSKSELAKKRNELNQLLKKPVFPKNFSLNYLASDNISRFRLVNNTSENAVDGMRSIDLANKHKIKKIKEIKSKSKKMPNKK